MKRMTRGIILLVQISFPENKCVYILIDVWDEERKNETNEGEYHTSLLNKEIVHKSLGSNLCNKKMRISSGNSSSCMLQGGTKRMEGKRYSRQERFKTINRNNSLSSGGVFHQLLTPKILLLSSNAPFRPQSQYNICIIIQLY